MFRILIAEDDPSTARLLGAIVKREGYEPLIAADGVQALEMLDHNHIDLLLCDRNAMINKNLIKNLIIPFKCLLTVKIGSYNLSICIINRNMQMPHFSFNPME